MCKSRSRRALSQLVVLVLVLLSVVLQRVSGAAGPLSKRRERHKDRDGVGELAGPGVAGQSGLKAHMKRKRKHLREAEQKTRERDEALFLSPVTDEGSSIQLSPIVLATVECFTPSSVLVRNLLYSISRFTTRRHPVRFYIMHTFDQALLPHPQSILCKDLGKCQLLLQFLREKKFIDVRFSPVENNSFVAAFRPCASSHLWLARSLPHESHVIYLNRDMVVKQDLQPLYHMFSWFPSETVLATSFELNNKFEVRQKRVSPYRSGIKDRRGPYWMPPYGANAGMLLYDLKKMRQFRVVEDFEFIIDLNMSLPLGDQDVVNYFLCQQPFRFNAVSCKWNYRANPKYDSDHCAEGSISEGILHGSRKLYLEAAANSKYYLTDHPLAKYYDGYVNSTRDLILEFMKNNLLLSQDNNWPD